MRGRSFLLLWLQADSKTDPYHPVQEKANANAPRRISPEVLPVQSLLILKLHREVVGPAAHPPPEQAQVTPWFAPHMLEQPFMHELLSKFQGCSPAQQSVISLRQLSTEEYKGPSVNETERAGCRQSCEEKGNGCEHTDLSRTTFCRRRHHISGTRISPRMVFVAGFCTVCSECSAR